MKRNPTAAALAAMLLAPALSRWTMVGAIRVFPYAKETGLGRTFKESVGWLMVAVASLIAIGATVGWLRWQGALAALVLVGVAMLTGVFFTRRLGGLTGDVYGAINEIVEVSALGLLPVMAALG